jgi:N-acetylglucosaminyldiphosphoundecaprenol N-acetyl-beta-D-mannosaminyltransferase
MKKKNVKSIDKLWQLWNIPIFGGKRSQLLKRIERRLEKREGKLFWMVTVNPEHMMKALEDPSYLNLLQESSLNVADGVGLIWAKRVIKGRNALTVGVNILRGKYRSEVIAGSGLIPELAVMAVMNRQKFFFLGGFGDRAKRTAAYFEKEGVRAEYSPGEPEISNDEVIKKIKEAKPQILLVAYGMKKQEEWIQRNRQELEAAGVLLVMGVGRSFDYYSGDLKRAPEAWQKMGLEWLYSLIQEPKRWRRQLQLPKFVWRVIAGN